MKTACCFTTILILPVLGALPAMAMPSDLPSIQFQHKDWQLVCDNTRTCRAAGYRAEDDDKNGNATILMTRAAGPDQPIKVELQLAEDENIPAPATVNMSIGSRALGAVRIGGDANMGTLTAAQGAALLPALLKDERIVWSAGMTTWTISTAGANAVLLKMDAFQGRIGTPGALARKGARPESSVLPALPLPPIHAAAVLGTAPLAHPFSSTEKVNLLAALKTTLKSADCNLLDSQAPDDAEMDVWQLDKERLLVSHRCWTGAYNSGDGYWVIASKPPYAPVLVTDAATGYENGEIMSYQKGRGIGDCWAQATWTWDGRAFAQTSASTSGMCRDIAAGGAWTLPTIVTRLDKHR